MAANDNDGNDNDGIDAIEVGGTALTADGPPPGHPASMSFSTDSESAPGASGRSLAPMPFTAPSSSLRPRAPNAPRAPAGTFDYEAAGIRLPPHSIQAEQSVLGGLMLSNEAFDKIADCLVDVDFYRDDHRRIFRAITKLVETNKAADILTVAEQLKMTGELAQIGGITYLADLTGSVPSASNIALYAEIIRDRALMRRLAQAGETISSNATTPHAARGDGVMDARQMLDNAEKLIFDISESRGRQRGGPVEISSLLSTVMENLDELAANPSSITGVETGFIDLDEMTCGMHGGDLIILAGRPSMGKTAMALNFAEHVALALGLPTLIYSMEMGGTQIAQRFLSSVAKVDQQALRTGRLESRDWDRLNEAMAKLNSAPIHVDETPALTAIELRARARRMWRQFDGLGLIVVDYLQLMSSAGGSKGENRATEISEISRSLKALAKELKCPVLALSQLNRSLEQRPNKRPVMSDLRESGAIEQDADVILFVYRDEVYNPESPDAGVAEVIIGKQRNGPIGTVKLSFQGQFTKFANLAHAHRTLGYKPPPDGTRTAASIYD